MTSNEQTFAVKQYVCYDYSYGSTEPEEVEMQYTIGVHEDKTYGWFEMYDNGDKGYYAEGGLWFTNNKLVDYDGVFSLPTEILDNLESRGFDVKDMRESLA